MDMFRRAGFTFYFAFAEDGQNLHITKRHKVQPEDAVETFFSGETTFNQEHLRFETITATHKLYWAYLYGQRGTNILVISCFSRAISNDAV
jgi:hypothetical protein